MCVLTERKKGKAKEIERDREKERAREIQRERRLRDLLASPAESSSLGDLLSSILSPVAWPNELREFRLTYVAMYK